jgi:hypothetical protein
MRPDFKKVNLDIPLVARIVYCLIQILKVACLTEMKSVVQLLTKYSEGLAPKPMLSKAFLNWVHGKNELADILGYGFDASIIIGLFLPKCR